MSEPVAEDGPGPGTRHNLWAASLWKEEMESPCGLGTKDHRTEKKLVGLKTEKSK